MALTDFEVLGVSPGASKAEIKAAYRARASACHPDLAGEHSKDQFQRLQAAYARLCPKPKPSAHSETKRTPPSGCSAAPEAPRPRSAVEDFLRDLGATVAAKGSQHVRAAIFETTKTRGKLAQAAGAFANAAIEEGEEALEHAIRSTK